MKTLLCVVLVLCFVGITAAQERVIDKSEFEALISNGTQHRTIWKDEKYRMTVTTSSKAEGRPATDWSSKIIVEYGSPTETRSLSSSMFGEKVNPTSETLRIGEWAYARSGDGPWTKKRYEPAAQKEPERLSELIGATTEYKHLGSGTFRDVPVQIYVKNEKASRVDKTSGKETLSDAKVTYWIDAKGTVLKSEYSSENRGTVTSRTLITTIWERDASISFTPPTVPQ